ncbi:MAG TPA: hypothetical protein VMC85_01720 [Desulfomonilaceae bacterium]|nr:hypothetical protein [Desulfomonilaceae bacterium]
MVYETKSNVRIFLDHLYASVCGVLVGFLVVYVVARETGHYFDLDDNIITCIVVVAALSLILAAYFTYKDLK